MTAKQEIKTIGELADHYASKGEVRKAKAMRELVEWKGRDSEFDKEDAAFILSYKG